VITSPNTFEVVENTTGVHQVTVSDADLPEDSFIYSLVGGEDQDRFTIDASGNLSFLAAPDFESPTDADTNNQYVIEVAVSDGVNTVTQSITVTVTPANEAPTATSLSAPETYTEDTPMDLTHIQVSDVDSAEVTVTLTLSDPAAGSLSTGSSGAASSTYNPVTGVWSASGGIANVTALLADVEFIPALNYCGNFTIAASVDDGVATPITGVKHVTGTPVGDTPQVASITTLLQTQSGLIVIDRNADDGAEVTHFRISGITNGALYHADGVTRINNGDYITYAQAQAGVRFTPRPGSTANGSFAVESSEDGVSVAAQSGVATSMITLTLPPEAPAGDSNSDTTEFKEQDQDASQDDSEKLGSEEQLPEEGLLQEDAPTIHESSGNKDGSQGGSATSIPGPPLAAASPSLELASVASMELEDVTESRSSGPVSRGEPETSAGAQKQNLQPGPAYEPILASSYEHLRNSLDALKEETARDMQLGKAVVGSTIAVSTGLSVGYVVWLIRGGTLLASVLSSMPAWQLADPLPILAGKREEADSHDEESLETIIEKDSPDHGKKEKDSGSTSGVEVKER